MRPIHKILPIFFMCSLLWNCQTVEEDEQKEIVVAIDRPKTVENRSAIPIRDSIEEETNNWKAILGGDTFRISVHSICQYDYALVDSSQEIDLPDSLLVLSYSNYTHDILISSKTKSIKVSVTKDFLVDSLSQEFVDQSLFVKPEFISIKDKEFLFTGFIGYPQSDNGYYVDFSIRLDKTVRVVRTYSPDL